MSITLSAVVFNSALIGFGANGVEPAGRAEGALSLELLDQLFERDLAAGAVGHSFPPGPMESQCFPKTLPGADATADATEVDGGLWGGAAELDTAGGETEAHRGASRAASETTSEFPGVEAGMDVKMTVVEAELNREPCEAASQAKDGIFAGATQMNSGSAGAATVVRGREAGLMTERAGGIAVVPQKSPAASVAEKLPFPPNSQLFATVAAKAASPPADICQVVVPAKLPLDSDLKPQRLSSAFTEAAGSSVAPAPPAATVKCAMSGSVDSSVMLEAAPGMSTSSAVRSATAEYGQLSAASLELKEAEGHGDVTSLR